MNEEFKVTLPKLGESIVSATVVQWFKKEGDRVQRDEALLEVSTDKVNSEIPSPSAGVLKKIEAKVDQEIEVGGVLAVLEISEKKENALPSETKAQAEGVASDDNKDFLSPSVLRAANEKGISLEDLRSIQGTGAGGRITKQDVDAFTCKKPPCPLQEERVKMTGMRKAIAENMVKSFYEAPHATLINEVDITNVMETIQKQKEVFYAEHGAKLTLTSFVIQAVTRALMEFPLLNSSLDQDTIIVKKYINMGIAVSVDQGLIVPVLKNCEKKSLPMIAQHLAVLSQKARDGKLQPDDVKEGTISITNFGMSGVSIGVPIIRFPEVAIIGIGAIKKKVGVIDEDKMAIRSTVHISLTFDHRVIDGMYGCGFLAAVQKHLEV